MFNFSDFEEDIKRTAFNNNEISIANHSKQQVSHGW